MYFGMKHALWVAAVLSLGSNYQSVSGFPQIAFMFPAEAYELEDQKCQQLTLP